MGFAFCLDLLCIYSLILLFTGLESEVHVQNVDLLRKPILICACLFDLILYIPSTIFQLNRDGSSWAEPVLS